MSTVAGLSSQVLCFLLVCANVAWGAEVVSTTVVIIGAGPAGLAAAQTLADENVDFILLEARDVLGGRVRSVTLAEGLSWNMGAGWIHGRISNGTDYNPIYEMATAANVQLASTTWQNMTVRTGGGAVVSADTVKHWYERTDLVQAFCLDKNEELWTQAENLSDGVEWESIDITLQACWDEYGYIPANASEAEQHTALALQWFSVDFDYCHPASELGVMWSLPENDDYNEEDLLVVGPYQGLMQTVADSLPGHSVRTGQKVTHVSYGEFSVNVTTEQGLLVVAEVAICTLPLGVLQQEVVQFDPPFSAARKASINKMNMGHYAKAIAFFPEVFWEPTEQLLVTINSSSPGLIKWAINLNHPKLYPGSKALDFHFVGDDAETVESMSETGVQAVLMQELHGIYGSDIPNATKIYVTNWTHDPYTYGSYSDWPYGYFESEWLEMTRSLDGHVFFAGEHTSENFGFVHSAWETGLEVAVEVLMELENRSWILNEANMSLNSSTTMEADDSLPTDFAIGFSLAGVLVMLPLHAILHL
mmetsp:Transcript_51549/g.95364  ORF Transcript_51549/g.95364 Transcript_51549/m.95364 type:complete len:533 (+) Transcript_51549:70-1668(+)